jgi:hypothetical protein
MVHVKPFLYLTSSNKKDVMSYAGYKRVQIGKSTESLQAAPLFRWQLPPLLHGRCLPVHAPHVQVTDVRPKMFLKDGLGVVMKNKIAYVAALALMASGMVFANKPSDLSGSVLPGSKEVEQQSGMASMVDPMNKLPGTVGAQKTPDAGLSAKGETPATGGAQYGLRGSASPDSDALPGTGTNPVVQAMSSY